MAGDALQIIECTKHFHVANEPSTKTLHRKICRCLFDDILIYSRSLMEHMDHVRKVLETLRDNKLYSNLKKCSFMLYRLLFLRFVVSANRFELLKRRSRLSKNGCRQELGGGGGGGVVGSFHGLGTFYRRLPEFQQYCGLYQ